MNSKRYLAIALVAVLGVRQSFAEDLTLAFEGPRMYGPIPSGLDLSLTYSGLDMDVAGGDTKLFLKTGGGYEKLSLLRDEQTGDPWIADADGYTFDKLNIQWDMAFIQGFARRGDGENLVEAFVYYRGRFEMDFQEDVGQEVFADSKGMFGTSIMGGVSYDSRVLSRHRSRDGVYIEATAEWGPGFINEKTDFWRVSSQFRGFMPVFDVPTESGNLFNVYLAGFAGVDYAGGASVPIYVNQSFGGRSLRDSLGATVRGYGLNKYDTTFKSVANAEIRFVGPALGIESVVPYLFGFADAGYYAGFTASTNYVDATGFIASTGGGFALDIFGGPQVSLIAGVRLIDDEIGYAYDPENFFWGIKFYLHF